MLPVVLVLALMLMEGTVDVDLWEGMGRDGRDRWAWGGHVFPITASSPSLSKDALTASPKSSAVRCSGMRCPS